jgi:hypothetical protein
MVKRRKKYTEQELNDMPLSALLTLALDDLAALKKAGKVKEQMSAWVEPGARNEPCLVCLGGAVLYAECGVRRQGVFDFIPDFAIRLDLVRWAAHSSGLPADLRVTILREYRSRLNRAPLQVYRKVAKELARRGL